MKWIISNAPVYAGAYQHQPPLDMAFGNLMIYLFGYNELSCRISAIIFGSLASALLAVLSMRLTGSFIISILSALVFSLNGQVSYFASSGRPISLGLFAGILILSSPLRLLSGRYKPTTHEWVFVMTSALFGLYSLGLQIPFLLAALILVTGLWYSQELKLRLHLISAWIAAIAIYLPIQITIFNNAASRFSQLPKKNVLDWLKEFRPENFHFAFDFFIFPILSIIILNGIFIFLFRRFYKRTRKKSIPNNIALTSFFYLGTAGLTFLALLVPFFKFSIEWSLNSYYVIIGLPCVILAWSGFLGVFLRPLRFAFSVSLVVATLTSAVLAYRSDSTILKNYLRNAGRHSTHRETLEAILKLQKDETGIIYNFCIMRSTRQCTPWLIGSKAYLDPYVNETGGHLEYPNDSTAQWLHEFNLSSFEPDWIYLVFEKEWSELPLPGGIEEHFPGAKSREFGTTVLLAFPNKEKKSRALLQKFYDHLSNEFKKKQINGIVIDPPIEGRTT